MAETELSWAEELEQQNKKATLVRELGTRYWDKDGNPVGATKGKTVVPEGATLNKLAVKGYTKKHKSRPRTPIFYSYDDIIRKVKDKFGTGVRKTHIQSIISNPDYALAPKGQPSISKADNIKFLVSNGYSLEQLNNLSNDKIRSLANEQRGNIKRRGVPRTGRVYKPKTKPNVGTWPEAVIKERRSKSSFARRGYPTPYLSPPFKAEMIGKALLPVIFPRLFDLDHIRGGKEGGSHIPSNYQALKVKEHREKTAKDTRMRGPHSGLLKIPVSGGVGPTDDKILSLLPDPLMSMSLFDFMSNYDKRKKRNK